MIGIALPLLVGATLLFTHTSEPKTSDSFSTIPVTKQWTFTFTHPISVDSVKENVYLLDRVSKKVPIQTTISANQLTITPISILQHDSNYELVITNQLKTAAGTFMNQAMSISAKTVSKLEPVTSSQQAFRTEYDFNWYSPSSTDSQFHLVGIKDGQTKGGYETRIGHTVFGIQIGTSHDAVKAKYGDPLTAIQKNQTNYTQTYMDKYGSEISGTYLLDHQYVTFFYDVHKKGTVRSIMWVDTSSEKAKPGFFADPSDALRNGFENLMVELINQARVAEKLQPLTFTPSYNEIARKHSISMATHHYFSHVDLAGQRGGARMKNGGVSYSWWGENLAYGQYSAIYAHEALMNSLSHRENILRKEFTHIFVGVAFNDQNQPYFTMNFYSRD